MRTPLLVVLLAAAAFLPACGKDEALDGVRVRILISAADGALEGTLQLQALGSGGDRIYEARPVGDGLYAAAGAPAGPYRLFTTKGWGMLWSGRRGSIAPELREANIPATVVRMGKPRSLYVASGMPDRWTVSGRWAAEWRPAKGDGVAFQPAPITIEDQGEGIYALRFTPEVWAVGHVIRVVGVMSDDTVTGMESYQVPDTPWFHLPRLSLLLGATQATLTVNLVPPPGVAQVPDGTPVRVHLIDVALEHAYEGQSFQGRCVFDNLAALGHGLRVELPQSACAFDLDQELWRTRASMHVAAVAPERLREVEVEERDGGYVEALVCYGGGSDFGRILIERVPAEADAVDHVARLRTHPGWQEWWLETRAGTWVYAAVEVPSSEDEMLRVGPDDTAGRGVRVRGRVRGGKQGSRVVFRQVHEALAWNGGDPVLPERRLGGDGFEAAVAMPDGDYVAELPPGRYEIRVVGAGGGGGRPLTLPFKPGAEVHLDLDAR